MGLVNLWGKARNLEPLPKKPIQTFAQVHPVHGWAQVRFRLLGERTPGVRPCGGRAGLRQAGPGGDLVRGLVVTGRGRTFHLALNTEHKGVPEQTDHACAGVWLPGAQPISLLRRPLSFLSETAPTSAYSSPARSLGDTGITPLSPSHIAVRDVSLRAGLCADDLCFLDLLSRSRLLGKPLAFVGGECMVLGSGRVSPPSPSPPWAWKGFLGCGWCFWGFWPACISRKGGRTP